MKDGKSKEAHNKTVKGLRITKKSFKDEEVLHKLFLTTK